MDNRPTKDRSKRLQYPPKWPRIGGFWFKFGVGLMVWVEFNLPMYILVTDTFGSRLQSHLIWKMEHWISFTPKHNCTWFCVVVVLEYQMRRLPCSFIKRYGTWDGEQTERKVLGLMQRTGVRLYRVRSRTSTSRFTTENVVFVFTHARCSVKTLNSYHFIMQ